jgi:FkbM family methyltransferase
MNLLLKQIRPLWLRAKIYYRLLSNNSSKSQHLFESAPLEFNSGIKLNLEPLDVGHQAIAFCGFYELELSHRIVSLAQKGGMLIDVGANYGYYSCLWAGANPQNKVTAFEASPRNFSPLSENIINNQLQSQVDIHELALGKEQGTLPFSFMSNEQTGWGGLALETEPNSIDVPVVTLDKFCSENFADNVIDVLKIDTEGADTWVLQGAAELLKEHKVKHIFFEENQVRMSALGISTHASIDLLVSCGYKLIKIAQGEWYATID